MIEQLEMVPMPPLPTRGTPLLALRLVVAVDGQALEPSPKGRPRATIVPGQRFPLLGMDPDYRRWLREALAILRGAWGDRETIWQPVFARIDNVFARPSKPVRHVTVSGRKVAYPWPWTEGRNWYLGTGGDVDNVAGAVMDALQPPPNDLQPRRKDPPGNPPLIDDRLIPWLDARQWYAAVGEEPCTEVRLWSAA
jgi:hypothetical protein